MCPGGGDFKRALGGCLALHFGKIGVARKSRRWRDGNGKQRLGSIEVSADFKQSARRQNAHALDERRFRSAGGGQNETTGRVLATAGIAPHRRTHGERPAHGTQLAGEREFAGKFMRVQGFGANLPRSDQDTQRDGQIETARFLGQIGRRKVDGDAALRKLEAAVLDRRAHALAGFLDLGIRQSHQSKGRQTGGEMNLDGDFRRGKTGQCSRAEDSERHQCLFGGVGRTATGFEFGHARLKLREFFARAFEHLALHVELLAGDQIESPEGTRQHAAQIFLYVGRRRFGQKSGNTRGHIVHEFWIEHEGTLPKCAKKWGKSTPESSTAASQDMPMGSAAPGWCSDLASSSQLGASLVGIE